MATGYYFISRELPSLDLQNILEDISDTLGAWTYLLVGAFAFAETGAFVGLVAPGETVMLLGGAVAGQGDDRHLPADRGRLVRRLGGRHRQLLLGRRLGAGLRPPNGPGSGSARALREGRGVLRPPRRQDDPHRPLHRPGPRLAPFIAGSSGMRYRAFVPYSILGTGLWASALILVGYFFSRSLDTAAKYAGKGPSCFGTASSHRR